EDIPAEMTDEEVEISQSTPRYRFDLKPSSPAPTAPETEERVQASPDAEAFVTRVTSDPSQPVVMFALEWCEFCWSVRKLIKEFDSSYRTIDVESAGYQEDN